MYSIFKYDIMPREAGYKPVTLRLSKDAEVLSVGVQGDKVYLWAKVVDGPEDLVEKENRHFIVLPTGPRVMPKAMNMKHLGTVFMMDAKLVFHVFEVTL